MRLEGNQSGWSLIYSLTLISYTVSFFRMAIYSLTLISFAVSFLISHFSFPLACLLKVDKIALSTFLTSVNVAQKVKKFKTLTSVKKNLGSLTKFFGKQREFFLLKKKNVLLKKKKFLLKRKKILLQRKFSGERSQKKEGSKALL